ncbi:MAG: DHA2 family efflux MFS transporter permease subunit [Gammaproteobacteria bacterium]|nr:DHA2 family efflux MFS transporter permease subunit [Gammaproteobacteria bacterium]
MSEPRELPPLQGMMRLFGAFALALATFMNVLDTSIANVSLSAIGGDLGAAASQLTWVITSFAVANAIAVPLTGWLAQRFGAVRLFTASILLFTAFSVLCGLANSLQMLIFFRVLQGAAAGPMIPLSQALLLSTFPRQKAGTALAVWAMTTLVAPVMGPMLGGWITDNISWPWIFYINLPVGLFAAVVTWDIYRDRETPRQRLPIDAVGLGLLMLWVGSLQILLDKGEELDWFASPVIVALAVTAALGFCVFLAWELVDNPHPVVDLRLFRGRNFWSGTLAFSLGYAVFFGNVVLLPLWLQEYMNYTATWAGLLTAPVGILALLLSPYVGRRVGRTDSRILATIAFAIFGVALYLRTFYDTDANFGFLVVPIIVQGAAMAFFFVPLVNLILAGLPPSKIPGASGLANFARITAGSFGTSLAITLWDDRAKLHHARLVESISAAHGSARAYFGGLRAAGLGSRQAASVIDHVVDAQARLLAADDVFWLSAMLFFAMIAVVWLAHRSQPGHSSDSASAAH